ncbi:Zinc-finger domain containing protein [Pandoravirus dulcis]|uniref:Zinc-finger domain containing protein n=1 Tax=Pandoravirus dulcis TaxID=1349409 RepID=S4VS68_9VIRU|nr:Zinc-finger domain containing protein [Pandoravirus dulcis]AGO83243.1 Zinc-finger domain containing protein [Pandoravirus dulcis]
MNCLPMTHALAQRSALKRPRDAAPSSSPSSSDASDDEGDARPRAKRPRSVRANSVLGVHVRDVPSGRQCAYCSDVFSRKTSVGNLRNHLIKKHRIGLVVDKATGPLPAPAGVASVAAATNANAAVAQSDRLSVWRAPPRPVATRPASPSFTDHAVLLADLSSDDNAHRRLRVVEHNLASGAIGSVATFGVPVGADVDFEAALKEMTPTSNLLVAVCSSAPAAMAARIGTAFGLPVLPCAGGLFADGAVSAAFDDPRVRQVVSRATSKAMWDPAFGAYGSRTLLARGALEHVVRSTDAALEDAADRATARQLVDALAPLDNARDLVAHPLMCGVGPALAVAARIAAVHYAASRRGHDGADDALIEATRARVADALAKHADAVLATDAGLLAVFFDPRTKDFAFVPDAARRRTCIARAVSLALPLLRGGAGHEINGAATACEGRVIARRGPTPATREPGRPFADAVSALFGADVGATKRDGHEEDSGADEIRMYEATRPAPLFAAGAEPVDPAAWWDARESIFPALGKLGRAYAAVPGVCAVRLSHPKLY